MPVQHWLTSYHTGVETIDALHEELFALMDRIHSDIIARAKAADIATRIAELAQRTVAHLDAEEEEMRRAAYPNLAAHAASHQILRRRLVELARHAVTGQPVGPEVLDALNRYFAEHIRQFDLAWAKGG